MLTPVTTDTETTTSLQLISAIGALGSDQGSSFYSQDRYITRFVLQTPSSETYPLSTSTSSSSIATGASTTTTSIEGFQVSETPSLLIPATLIQLFTVFILV